MAKDRPAKRVRLGCIEAAIWLNDSKEGKEWFRVTLTRGYQVGDEWRNTTSFGKEDLPVAAEALRMAYRWLWEQEAVWSGSGKSNGE